MQFEFISQMKKLIDNEIATSFKRFLTDYNLPSEFAEILTRDYHEMLVAFMLNSLIEVLEDEKN